MANHQSGGEKRRAASTATRVQAMRKAISAAISENISVISSERRQYQGVMAKQHTGGGGMAMAAAE